MPLWGSGLEILGWQQPEKQILGSFHPAWSCWCVDTGIWWWRNFSVEQGMFVNLINLSFLYAYANLLAFYRQVTTSIYNLILGKLYCDHYGTMRIDGNREYSCKLKFKEQSIIDRNPHQVCLFISFLENMWMKIILRMANSLSFLMHFFLCN